MATSQKSRSKDGLAQNPGRVGNALANVVSVEGGREVVLGQAWLAASNRLITCGHVVERYINAPGLLMVRFPASGNKYQISRIRLHPSFVRQPDQLVKFDVALLEVNLQPPESTAEPLPFSYEQAITTNQTLWAIRYPAHLGQLSAAPQPLTQDGRFLGPLRIHDTFHLLHDLPLSPGDSGAPISDGNIIVAVHCGDTATLPGLNLPTTSIRLALWVDALRELGINETASSVNEPRRFSLLPVLLAFLISALLVGLGAKEFYGEQARKGWSYQNPDTLPVKVSFNEPVDGYALHEDVVINITPSSDYNVLLFVVDSGDHAAVLFPQFGIESLIPKGQQRIIDQFGNHKMDATPDKSTCYLVAVRCDTEKGQEMGRELLKSTDWPPHHQPGDPLVISGKELVKRFADLKQENPDEVLFASFDAPRSK